MNELLEQLQGELEGVVENWAANQAGGHKYAPFLKAGLGVLVPGIAAAHDAAPPTPENPLHITIGTLGQPPVVSETLTPANPLYPPTK